MKTKEIETIEDIKLLVDSFYGKVRNNDVLAPIFNSVIQDRWPTHLQKMYTFWETVLLGSHTYNGHPFVPHAELPVDQHHFEEWLRLFYETLDAHFHGDKAEEAKWRAGKMAEMFYYRIQFNQNNPGRQIL